MTRPTKISGLSGRDFAAYYWLKIELSAFCREHRLPTAGSKQDLVARISHFLDTGESVGPASTDRSDIRAKMPTQFTSQTIIGLNWRCSQELRAYFESEIGPAFHFNQFMRNFIKQDGVGQPLKAAIEGWKQSKRADKKTSKIAPQFEYNRHFRDYFRQNPSATRADAIDAWNEKKAKRRS